MKGLAKIYLLIAVAVVAVAGYFVYRWQSSPDVSRVKMQAAYGKNLVTMADLCTLEIVEDVPLRAHEGKRHFFGRMRICGSVSFDLEGIEPEERGDTLYVTLPDEKVELYESTEPDSYQVIDTWNDDFFGSSKFTAAEENHIKRVASEYFRKLIYKKGYVKRARAEAVASLTSMLSGITRKIVVVNDPNPEGALMD